MFKKVLAFTMAEILLVIAVIGITAALALPTMTSDVDEKKVVSQVRKVYGELDTAYQDILAQEGKPPEWKDASDNPSTMTTTFRNKIAEKLSTSQNVGTDSLILKDGTLVSFDVKARNDAINASFDGEPPCTGGFGSIAVDIDGNQKGYNAGGRDKFVFDVCYVEGIVPAGTTNSGPIASNGPGATAWVIKAGNLDYLKCNDLNWNTKRTCK